MFFGIVLAGGGQLTASFGHFHPPLVPDRDGALRPDLDNCDILELKMREVKASMCIREVEANGKADAQVLMD